MERVAPSAQLRQEIEKLLQPAPRWSEGRSEGDPAGELLRLAARLVLQDALEAEQADFIGRDRYERGERTGHRNGYEPSRLDTAEGRLEVKVPQVRGTQEPY